MHEQGKFTLAVEEPLADDMQIAIRNSGERKVLRKGRELNTHLEIDSKSGNNALIDVGSHWIRISERDDQER